MKSSALARCEFRVRLEARPSVVEFPSQMCCKGTWDSYIRSEGVREPQALYPAVKALRYPRLRKSCPYRTSLREQRQYGARTKFRFGESTLLCKESLLQNNESYTIGLAMKL